MAAKLDAGELAVVYGHPERRLGRMPEVMTALARHGRQPATGMAGDVLRAGAVVAVAGRAAMARHPSRGSPAGDPVPRVEHRHTQFALEIHRGRFHCSLPVTGPCMSLGLAGLVYERSEPPADCLEPPTIDREAMSLKQAMRTALDWETVTPLDDIPRSSISNRLKRGLRWWKHKSTGASA